MIISLVQGHYNEANVKEWNGIPYATPPVGNLRWEQSIPPTPWGDDVYNGLTYSPTLLFHDLMLCFRS